MHLQLFYKELYSCVVLDVHCVTPASEVNLFLYQDRQLFTTVVNRIMLLAVREEERCEEYIHIYSIRIQGRKRGRGGREERDGSEGMGRNEWREREEGRGRGRRLDERKAKEGKERRERGRGKGRIQQIQS